MSWTAPGHNGGSAITSYRDHALHRRRPRRRQSPSRRPGDLEDDHRPHRRHRLHLHGHRRRTRSEPDRTRPPRTRSPRPRRPRPTPRPASARPVAGTGDRELDRARRTTAAARSRATRVTPYIGSDRADPGHRRRSPRRRVEDGHRPHQRHHLHVQGRRRRTRSGPARLGSLELRHADRADAPGARPASARPAATEQATVSWTAPAQRRQSRSRLHDHALHRLDRADADDDHRLAAGDDDDDHRPHQRHHLHLQGHRDERDRDRPALEQRRTRSPRWRHRARRTRPASPRRPATSRPRVSWTAPAERRQPDHELHGHPVHRLDRPDADDDHRLASGDDTTITGLTNGTTYTFTVTATNAVGTGPGSSASNTVTPSATVSPPTFVQQVSAHGAGNSLSVAPSRASRSATGSSCSSVSGVIRSRPRRASPTRGEHVHRGPPLHRVREHGGDRLDSADHERVAGRSRRSRSPPPRPRTSASPRSNTPACRRRPGWEPSTRRRRRQGRRAGRNRELRVRPPPPRRATSSRWASTSTPGSATR